MASHRDEIVNTAQAAYDVGDLPVSILPDQKHPGFKGHSDVYDGRPRPTWAQIREQFQDPQAGVALHLGEVSRGLAAFDIEDEDTLAEFEYQLQRNKLTSTWERLKAGYTETTRSGGIHVLFLPDGFEASSKTLARWGEATTHHEKKTRLEILGGKKHIVVAPTKAKGTPGYRNVSGDFSTVESLSERQYLQLLECAYQLDQGGTCRPTDAGVSTNRRRLSGEEMPTHTLAPMRDA